MSAATCGRYHRREKNACKAPTPRTPGYRCGAAKVWAGSASIRPTISWSRTITSSWPSVVISPTSRRSTASSWVRASRSSTWRSMCCWSNDREADRHASRGRDSVWLARGSVSRRSVVFGAQVAEKFFDFTREALCRRGQVGRRRKHRRSALVGVLDGFVERSDIGDERRVAVGGELRVLRDLAGRRILLSDRTRDVGRDVVDLADGGADFAYGFDCVFRRDVDQADVLADFGRGLGGLPGERFDFVGHHGKAAASFAGACGFDRGVERQKVGLFGNGLDEGEHAVDALGCRSEAFDFGDRFFGTLSGLLDRLGRLTHLPADLLDRRGELFGGASHRENVAGGLFGRAGGGACPAAGVGSNARNGLSGIAHGGGIIVHRAQHASDRAAEGFNRRFDLPGSLFARFGIQKRLCVEVAVVIHRFLKDLDRAGQCADFVLPMGMRNLDALRALGDPLDGGRDRRKRTRDRAGNDEDTGTNQHQRNSAKAGQEEGELAVQGGV